MVILWCGLFPITQTSRAKWWISQDVRNRSEDPLVNAQLTIENDRFEWDNSQCPWQSSIAILT